MTGNAELLELEARINDAIERAPNTCYACLNCGGRYIDPQRACPYCDRSGPHVPFTEPIKISGLKIFNKKVDIQ